MKIIIIVFTLFLIGCSAPSETKKYSQEEINYFTDIALGAEFGDSVPVIKKWENDIRIKINGEPTDADIISVDSLVNDLNNLINEIDIKIVNKNPNITITYSPEADFATIDPNYVPTNYGFFWALWHDDNYVIYNASILISSANISQAERSHLVREELTQSLGLMNDSDKYDNSIFYQDWTAVNQYSSLDNAVIEMLYLKNIKAGMSKDQVLTVFN